MIKKLLLVLAASASFAQVFTQDAPVSNSVEIMDTKGKVKKFNCVRTNQLTVCDNAVVGGTLNVSGLTNALDGLVVNGAATVGSIALSPAAAIGTPGVPGVGGDLAYGSVGNATTTTIANGDPIDVFSDTGLPLSGVTASSTGITVTNAGIYRIQLAVSGYDASSTSGQIIFALYVNGSINLPFASPVVVPGSITAVNGFSIISLPAGAVLTIVNISGYTVTLPSFVVNAMLTVERIA